MLSDSEQLVVHNSPTQLAWQKLEQQCDVFTADVTLQVRTSAGNVMQLVNDYERFSFLH